MDAALDGARSRLTGRIGQPVALQLREREQDRQHCAAEGERGVEAVFDADKPPAGSFDAFEQPQCLDHAPSEPVKPRDDYAAARPGFDSREQRSKLRSSRICAALPELDQYPGQR